MAWWWNVTRFKTALSYTGKLAFIQFFKPLQFIVISTLWFHLNDSLCSLAHNGSTLTTHALKLPFIYPYIPYLFAPRSHRHEYINVKKVSLLICDWWLFNRYFCQFYYIVKIKSYKIPSRTSKFIQRILITAYTYIFRKSISALIFMLNKSIN